MEALVYGLASFTLQLVVLHMQLRLLADHMMVSDIFVGVSSLITIQRTQWTGGYQSRGHFTCMYKYGCHSN